MYKKKVLFFILTFLFSNFLIAREIELTVYNQNFALVKERRYLNLEKGLNKVQFQNIAALIEPSSVHFTSLTDPSCVILEQNYEYDLVSSDKLLSKYIDKNLKVITKDERVFKGKLLSYDNNNLIVSSSEGLNMIARKNITQIIFEKIPEGLITKPTLIWYVKSTKDGKHLTEVSYLTEGVNWHCEYVAVLDKEDKEIDLDAWINITNKSGATFKNAKLKLIAGEVKRAEPEYEQRRYYEAKEYAPKPMVKEKSFFEYYLYSLQRKTTLKNNQTKQISFLNAKDISVRREFVFDPSRGGRSYLYYSDSAETIKENVKVELEFSNSEKNNLGIPLPEGKIKVYKKDDKNSLQFVGEDRISHTLKDEKVKLYIGDAFDIIGERKRVDYKKEYHTIYETYKIVLRNHKEEDVKIKVIEKMWRYTNWEITDSSSAWMKKDDNTIEFEVNIPKNSKKVINYTVKYWW